MNSEDSPSPTGLESYLVRLAWHSTLGLAVVVVMGMASPELLGPVVVVFSSLLFALGLGMLALGLLAGLRRSRDEEVTVTGLFLLYGSAPFKVRKVFGWALGLQLVVACAGAAVRPYTQVAFGILAPMILFGSACLWSARFGSFSTRGPGTA